MGENSNSDGLKEVANEVIGLERNKIWGTIKYLTIKPGQVVSEFCSGEKHKYVSPVAYFLGVETVMLYVSSISGLSDFLSKRAVGPITRWLGSKFPSLAGPKDETDRIVHDLSNSLSFFNTEIGKQIIGLPILLLITWLLYRRFNKSFKENSWFALYTAGTPRFCPFLSFLLFT